MAHASCDDAFILRYLDELNDANMADDLVEIPQPEMKKTDRKLYAAIMNSARHDITAKVLRDIISASCLGSGRKATRIVDAAYQYEATRLQVKATSRIISIRAKGMNEAAEYLSDFKLCKMQMGTGDEKLTPTLGIELLKQALMNVEQLKATIAAFVASGSSDMEELIHRLDKSVADWISQRNRQSAGGAFGAGGKGDGNYGGGGPKGGPGGGPGGGGLGMNKKTGKANAAGGEVPYCTYPSCQNKKGHRTQDWWKKQSDEGGGKSTKGKSKGKGKKGKKSWWTPKWCSTCRVETHNTAECYSKGKNNWNNDWNQGGWGQKSGWNSKGDQNVPTAPSVPNAAGSTGAAHAAIGADVYQQLGGMFLNAMQKKIRGRGGAQLIPDPPAPTTSDTGPPPLIPDSSDNRNPGGPESTTDTFQEGPSRT
jgi:hypothetical protein